MGYSPQGHREPAMTERLSFSDVSVPRLGHAVVGDSSFSWTRRSLIFNLLSAPLCTGLSSYFCITHLDQDKGLPARKSQI